MATDDLILLRGGGDLASGIALRLHRAGFKLVISELAQPLAVRRSVSFSEAVYAGMHRVEDAAARRAVPDEIAGVLKAGEISMLVDPEASILLDQRFHWAAVIDARMIKQSPAPLPAKVPLLIGLGPGFEAGVSCDAFVETRRSHTLGRVYWEGKPQTDSGLPEGDPRRVLRAPFTGVISDKMNIGEHVEAGQPVASIHTEDGDERLVTAPLAGVLRGLIHDGLRVPAGMKIGDIDPRDDPSACWLVSDKSLSIAGGVLEAILMFERRT